MENIKEFTCSKKELGQKFKNLNNKNVIFTLGLASSLFIGFAFGEILSFSQLTATIMVVIGISMCLEKIALSIRKNYLKTIYLQRLQIEPGKPGAFEDIKEE